MIKSFIKLFILTMILCSNIYAITTTDDKNFQNEINNIKIEVEKLKVVQQYSNKDDKLKEVETSIKSLEDKFTKIIEKDVAVQDKRISDLNFFLTLYGVIITILLLIASWGSYKLALNETTTLVKKWLEEKADKEFKPKVDEYLGQLQNKGDELLKQIETEASKQHQKHDDLINEKVAEFDLRLNELTPKERAKVESDVKNLETKNESEYTYNDWYSKFLQQNFKNNFDKALEYINRALEIANNDIESVQALYGKGVTLGRLGKGEEAIKEYQKLINKFSGSINENILELVAKALVNQGAMLGGLGKSEEEIQKYQKVIDKFSQSTNEQLFEVVAKSLMNKGIRLGTLEKGEEEIKEYDKVIDKFSNSTNEKLLEQVGKALVNKGFRLGTLGKGEEEIKEYDKVIDKFSSSTNEKLLEQVGKALVNKGFRLGILGKSEEAIKECDKVIDKFSNSTNEKILETVANALGNKIENLLISNQDVKEDLKTAKERFKNNQNEMIIYSMLEILYNAQISNQDNEIEKWKEEYKNVDLGTWRFDALEEWNNHRQNDDVKQRIKDYIAIFKTKNSKLPIKNA